MLTITNVKKTFNKGTVNEKKALNGINLHLAPGDFVTIIGGNGAGKSTMLNMIAGVYPIDEGKIILDGTDISRKPEYARAKYLGRVFQDPMKGTAAGMEIQENLALAYRRGRKRGLKWAIGKDEQVFYKEQLKALDLGLEDRMTSKVGLLSGGQLVDLPLPCLRGYPLAAVFQFFQIPGCCIIQDQFPAVALLEQFPFLRLHLGKLLMDSLVLVVLRPHLPALGEDSDPALGLNDLSPQVIVTGVHIGNFFMELLHGLDTVCLQKAEQGGALLQSPDFFRCGCRAA